MSRALDVARVRAAGRLHARGAISVTVTRAVLLGRLPWTRARLERALLDAEALGVAAPLTGDTRGLWTFPALHRVIGPGR